MSALRLVIERDGHELASHPLSAGVYTLGRGSDNDFVLDDKKVSRRHARLSVEGDGLRLEDLGSSNGLFFEGNRVRNQLIFPGQSLEVRPFSLRLELDRDEPTQLPGAFPLQGEQAFFRLVVQLPNGSRQVSDLRPGRNLVGRGSDCHIRIEEPSVSRQHAELTVDRGVVTLLDLGSTSGTFVDGKRVFEARLLPREHLVMGRATLEMLTSERPFEVPSPPAAPPLPPPVPQPRPEPAAAPGPAAPARGRRWPWLAGLGLLLTVTAAGGAWWFLGARQPPPLVTHAGSEPAREQPAPPPSQAQPHDAVGQMMEAQRRAEEQARQRLLVVRLEEARKALEKGQLPQAAEAAADVLRMEPAHPQASALLAQAQEEQARQEQQRREREAAAQRSHNESRAALERGRAALEQGQHAQAIEWARKAQAALPDNPQAKRLEAAARQAQSEQESQRQKTAERGRQRQQEAKESYQRGLMLAEKGDLVGASKAWAQAEKADPEHATPYAAKAGEMLRQARQKLGEQAEAAFARGQQQQKAGQTIPALAAYREALRLAPWHQGARAAQEALARDSQEKARNLYAEGRVHESMGDIEEAIKKWKLALSMVSEGGEDARKLEACLRKYQK